ncbi:hypothetical protein DWX43_14975 [Clostridium sp. AF19-22AC]|jgi:hypothetical protein|uniref:Uncharacterized protein n=1 Tax=Faecalicatena orotica TaxID=1544 RepID=A0A2Y9CAA3_9FIRM|nr:MULTISPECIES: hypothetical protein [Clostridia]PWJ28278.1 hypothetical protein A8806_109158 [Faecalicatena orotica]RHR27132.1 hypothetical protein DWX43_14975 [Clostridium sp. AF19-22AC]SSA56733.1 hypothetical protein SAMN05216536_109158 [Faecalicatena orotica]
MGMGIGINVHSPDAGKIKGHQEPVACGVWYTSTGTAIPKMIKFQDADGHIRTLSNLHVRTFEKKNYCGIPTLEYECDAVVNSRKYIFHLLYYVEHQKWTVLWKSQSFFNG